MIHAEWGWGLVCNYLAWCVCAATDVDDTSRLGRGTVVKKCAGVLCAAVKQCVNKRDVCRAPSAVTAEHINSTAVVSRADP
jgi:hypothetical protein